MESGEQQVNAALPNRSYNVVIKKSHLLLSTLFDINRLNYTQLTHTSLVNCIYLPSYT